LGVERSRPAAHEDVVAVERDVHGPDRRLDPAPLGDQRAQAPGERGAARVDADEREPGKVVVTLDQLVGQSRDGSRESVFVEDLARRVARG
jgi:hypothetical protein